MKKATRGTIEESDMMQKAVKLMTLGYDTEKIERFSQTVHTAAMIAGTTDAEAYDNLADAIANRMPKALVRMGAITREQMKVVTEAIAAGADETSLYELAMANLEAKEKMLQGTQDQATVAIQRFHAEVKETKETLGKGIIWALQELYSALQYVGAGSLYATTGMWKLFEAQNEVKSKLSFGNLSKEYAADAAKYRIYAETDLAAANKLSGKAHDNMFGEETKVGKTASSQEISDAKAKVSAQVAHMQAIIDAAKAAKTADRDAEVFARQQHANDEAYLAYSKAFDERVATQAKAAASEQEAINKQQYDTGIIDLAAYLDKKHQMTQSSNQSELDAKLKEVSDAGGQREKANLAYKQDPTGDTAKNATEADAKLQSAIKAVIEARSKMTLAGRADAEETRKQTSDQVRGFQELQASFLEMQGDYAAAADVRRKIDDDSEATQHLVAAAMTGDQAAMDAYWAHEALNIKKGTDASRKAADELANIQLAELSNSMALVDVEEKYYQITTGEAAQKRRFILEEELSLHKQKYATIQGNEPTAQSLRLQEQAEIDRINASLLEQKRIITETYGTAIAGLKDGIDAYKRTLPSTFQEMSQLSGGLAKDIEGDFATLFDDTLHGKIDSFSKFFSSVVDNMIAEWSKMAAQMTMNDIFGKSGGWGDMFKSISGLFGGDNYNTGWLESAKGNVFSGGNVMAFANGGIVSRPTLFPMANGGTGLMGEAGEEAILPLRRTRNGRLGVETTGGGSSLTINVPVSVEGNNRLASTLRSEIEATVIRVVRAHS